ncbi:hypothetical protein FHETE_2542 [Fusarium heterosporum]|uniref:Uncharacterized protein n=1 Tax=Fusarium heterosporum TaxID=42747 RepID=A0A8H5WYC3_FUSHE|nr:hypothetical protein FHETE_2542 [Fusarium heterosporum]
MVASIQGLTPKASFLGIPQELRDQIYHHYFKVEGGYTHDGAIDKIVRADGNSIDISLRYVCRSIAWETRNCALSLNSITFSPVCRDDWRSQALRLTHILKFQSILRVEMLFRLGHLLTGDMFESPSPEYAQYMPVIEADVAAELAREVTRPRPRPHPSLEHFSRCQKLKEGYPTLLPIGEFRMTVFDNTVSCNRTVVYLLRLLAEKHPAAFSEAIEEVFPGWADSHSVQDFLNIGFDHWAVPSNAEMVEIWKVFQFQIPWECSYKPYVLDENHPHYHGPKYRYTQKYFFSATAMAIRFLKQLPQCQRRLIQLLILNEDKAATGNPQSHIFGLIPFCKENPKLQIEHRVNVWTNMLVAGEELTSSRMAFVIEWPPDPEDDSIRRSHQTPGHSAAVHFAYWVLHTLAAIEDGMPAQSYKLLFDGGPDLNHATETFTKLFKLIIAWLTLNTDCVKHGILAPPGSHQYPFTTSSSTEGLASVYNRSSVIQCNFYLDQPWDFEAIANGYAMKRTTLRELGLSGLSWLSQRHLPDCWDVSTSKLDWVAIRLEYYDLEKLCDSS